MRGPVTKAEIWLLRVLFASAAVSFVFWTTAYFRLPSPSASLAETSSARAEARSGEEVAQASIDRANSTAIEAIQDITRAGLLDRAFREAKASLGLMVVFGYLLWRLRGNR
jgi:hypothetical protein